MAELIVDCKTVNGVEMFLSEPYFSEAQKRIFGYKDSKRLGKALYPAFMPLAVHTVNDLKIVFEDTIRWTPAARRRLAEIEEAVKRLEENTLPPDFNSPLPPFEHQKEAIVKALYNERYAIFHDCGLGKTKTLIDVWRVLKNRMGDDFKALLLCPSYLGVNWSREILKHSFEGELSVCRMLDESNNSLPPAERLEIYTGVRELNPPKDSRFAEDHPDLYYEPLPGGLSSELYEVEDIYVRAILSGDSKGRSRARSRLRRLAKSEGVELPRGSWRMLDPAPKPAKDYDILIVSYDTAATDIDLILKHYPYNVIAADESHNLRGTSSARSKAACKLASRAQRRYLLSGTPSLGDPMHMFQQLRFLSPVLTGNWFQYQRRYLVRAKHNQKMVVGFKNLHVLNDIVSNVTHRKKREECLDLPPVRIIDVPVEVDSYTKNVYNDLVATRTANLGKDYTVKVPHPADRVNKFQQVLSGFFIDSQKDYELCDNCPFLMSCAENRIKPYTSQCKVKQEEPPKKLFRFKNSPRLESCTELLESILQEAGNKVIIWCSYTEEINMLEERLQQMGTGYVRVDGRTKDKVAAEDRFREDKSCRVYLSHISICEGLTLNSANYTIYYGLTYDLKDYIQSMKRNDRVGQTRPVTVYRMITPGTIQEYIVRSLNMKKNIANAMTDAVQCGVCRYSEYCQVKDIRPFEEGCKYKGQQKRVITEPQLL